MHSSDIQVNFYTQKSTALKSLIHIAKIHSNQLIEITIFCEYILLRKKLSEPRWNTSDMALESPNVIRYDLYIT